MEVKKYASTFHSALNPMLKELVEGDEHIMRACSLLAILPPPSGTSLRHLEIPMDLDAMRLPDWVNKIQDLATGMVMLPPTFLVTGAVVQSSVLPKLERVSGVRACRFCLHPHTLCGCGQVPSWSHTSTRQALAMVTIAHSHATTSVSTSISCSLPDLSPQGAAAPTGTYSEALTFNKAPQTHMRGVSHPPLPRVGYPSVDPCQTAPIPRKEAPIRQECPVVSQNEPRTLYQQQIQAPVLSTHSTWVGRGAILELMQRKSEELECQAASVGHGQGLSTKKQGAIPKKYEEALGQNPQSPSCGRGRSHLRRGVLNRGNRANPLHVKEAEQLPPLVVPPLLLQSSWVTFTPGMLWTSGERGGRKMPTGHTCGTSPSPSMLPLRRLTPLLLQ